MYSIAKTKVKAVGTSVDSWILRLAFPSSSFNANFSSDWEHEARLGNVCLPLPLLLLLLLHQWAGPSSKALLAQSSNEKNQRDKFYDW